MSSKKKASTDQLFGKEVRTILPKLQVAKNGRISFGTKEVTFDKDQVPPQLPLLPDNDPPILFGFDGAVWMPLREGHQRVVDELWASGLPEPAIDIISALSNGYEIFGGYFEKKASEFLNLRPMFRLEDGLIKVPLSEPILLLSCGTHVADPIGTVSWKRVTADYFNARPENGNPIQLWWHDPDRPFSEGFAPVDQKKAVHRKLLEALAKKAEKRGSKKTSQRGSVADGPKEQRHAKTIGRQAEEWVDHLKDEQEEQVAREHLRKLATSLLLKDQVNERHELTEELSIDPALAVTVVHSLNQSCVAFSTLERFGTEEQELLDTLKTGIVHYFNLVLSALEGLKTRTFEEKKAITSSIMDARKALGIHFEKDGVRCSVGARERKSDTKCGTWELRKQGTPSSSVEFPGLQISAH